MKKKCLVLLSGGLDSRLVVKIMQEKGFAVTAVFFKLPFGTGCCNENCSFNFSQMQGVKLKIFDCTKGKLLKEYLDVVKNPKYGRGAGVNPCVDCRIFMFSKAKKFADKNKIKFIATGEVEGQRPMSQMKKSLKIIEEKSGLGKRLLRPLSELGITGRQRKKQIELAKKFKISFPHPAGGCVLCEKELKNRFKFLLNRGLNDKEIKFVNVGRHFVIDNCWVVLGRDEKENKILEKFGAIVPDFLGPSALMLDKCGKEALAPKGVPRETSEEVSTKGKKINKLIGAYSKRGSLKERKKFERLKI